MDRRVPAGAGPGGDDRPRADQPDRHQGRALQPLPRRDLPVARRVDPARPGKPQRHGRRRAAASAATTLLQPGDIIRIGQSQLVFVHDLSKAFPESSDRSSAIAPTMRDDETVDASDGDRRLERAGGARADDDHASPRADEVPRAATRPTKRRLPKIGRAAAKLVPPGLRAGQGARRDRDGRPGAGGPVRGHAGRRRRACCCCRGTTRASRTADDLEVVASRTDSSLPYHRVSNFLAATVLREGEAVLARNVMGDSTLGSRDSKGEVHATSVICAPIRRGKRVFGLIHLYSTNDERVPDPDDLEFTLAVADTVAVALENLSRRAGTGRESHPDSRRERATARAAGRAERDRRPQRGDAPGGRGDRPRRRQPAPRC